MKITLEIPDALFRRAKEFVSEVLAEKLRVQRRKDKPWLKSFGKLRSLRKESARISRTIQQELGQIEPRNWQCLDPD